ncbi:MAG TPA: alpha/beta hydrolase [Solirubrobacteraceae bacterium]
MSDLCLVHGAWHDDMCWEPLLAQLRARGHHCVAPLLPLDDLEATFEDYARVVADEVRAAGLASPVLVGHSMSSAVIPLLARECDARMLVYLCPAMAGFPPLSGEPDYRRAGYQPPPVDADGSSWWPRERAIDELYGRLEHDVASRLADRLRPQPRAPFDAPYPLQAPPDTHSLFLYAREDELFDDNWSRWIAQAMLGVEPRELPSGHFPMLEQTALLADELERG